MKTYLAFLRGINVSGQKKIKMADLRASLASLGFENVNTYIQSGNVLLERKEVQELSISKKIEDIILKDFGFKIPVLVCAKEKVETILNKYPFIDAEDKNKYFALLHEAPKMVLIEEFNKLKFSAEDFLITEHCVYLNCKQGAGKAKLNTTLIERKLKVIATSRNLRTMQKMLEMAN